MSGNLNAAGSKGIQVWTERREAFDTVSTARSAYVAHGAAAGRSTPAMGASRSTLALHEDEPKQPSWATTARSSYVAHGKPERATPQTNANRTGVDLRTEDPGRFYEASVSRSAYVAHERADRAVPSQVARKSSISLHSDASTRFDGSSTAKSSYVAHGVQDRVLPSAKAATCTIDLKDEIQATGAASSTSRSTYVAHGSVEHRIPAGSAAKASLVLGGDKREFYGETTNKSSFPAHPAHQADLVAEQKQEAPVVTNNGHFYGETTSLSSYPRHVSDSFSTRAINPTHQTKSLDGIMLGHSPGALTTTNRSSYVAHPVSPRQAPPPAPIQAEKHYFIGSTTSADHYKAWSLDKPTRMSDRRPEQFTDSRDFYGQTTSRESYKGLTAQRSAPFVPVSSLKSDGVFFAGETTNRESFRGWQLPKQRQSVGLETVNDRFVPMVTENAVLPHRTSQVFTTVSDNQSSVEITVRQGNSSVASENAVLASFELVGIPPGPVGSPKIEVIFDVNEKGVLHIEARDKVTGVHQHIAIDKLKNIDAFA